MIAYNYDLIVGPSHRLIHVLFELKLIETRYSRAHELSTNGELHTLLVSYK